MKEALIVGLVGGIPLSLGRKIRQFFYRFLLAKLGDGVQFQPNVALVGTRKISIGNQVKIEQGVNLRNWGLHSEIRLGDGVSLDIGVMIKTHQHDAIELGDRTYVGPYTCISGNSIKIGRDCLIASHCGIYANNHVFADPLVPINTQGATYKGIVIEDDCWLGCGVKVVDGVTIGKGSVIGAGSVVTKNIPPYAIAVGVPAKVVSWRKTPSELPSLQTSI